MIKVSLAGGSRIVFELIANAPCAKAARNQTGIDLGISSVLRVAAEDVKADVVDFAAGGPFYENIAGFALRLK